MKRLLLALIALALLTPAARAETPDEWVALGTRIHGFFGGFIPAGIRIGLDAKDRLKVVARHLAHVRPPTATLRDHRNVGRFTSADFTYKDTIKVTFADPQITALLKQSPDRAVQ
jgi:hypothetical protein